MIHVKGLLFLFVAGIGVVLTELPPPRFSYKGADADVSRRELSEEDALIEAAKLTNELMNGMKGIEMETMVDEGTSTSDVSRLHQTTAENQELGHCICALTQALAQTVPRDGNDSRTFKDTELGREHCFEEPDCTEYANNPYRSMTGVCNNLNNGLLGMASTPSIRLVPPDYDDGVSSPRQCGSNGNRLKSARTVSSKALGSAFIFTPHISLMGMQWGQFLDHDITLTPVFQITDANGKSSAIQCCPQKSDRTTRPSPKRECFPLNVDNEEVKCCSQRENTKNILPSHPECFPIKVDKEDYLYSDYKVHCVNFVRSLPAPDVECNLSCRQQMNSISHFIDASNVYGSSVKELANLRDGRLMRTQDGNLLPKAEHSSSCPVHNQQHCFLAGDGRANEHTGLALMHTIWIREHNRISNYISNHSTGLDDETIFQMTRRIVTAEIQHITFKEYLRLILGENYLKEHNLAPELNIANNYPYHELYDANIDPSISNAFNTAAYRFGHGTIRAFLELYKKNGCYEARPLRSQFFKPYGLYDKDFRSGLAIGLGRTLGHKPGGTFSPEVTDHLFQKDDELIGLDLTALNIQRGRDHGLPSFNKYREYCNLSIISNFDEFLGDEFGKSVEVRNALEEVYASTEDVDLFVGGMLEKLVEGTQLGPTFLCIIGDQFKRLKFGDRYFYDNNMQPQPFNQAQLMDIKRKLTLSSVMCLNRDAEIQTMQRNIFFTPSESNALVDCDDIEGIDLNLFLP